MTEETFRTLSGSETILDGAAVDELRAGLGDCAIAPTDKRYDQARRVWNGMIDKRPALIVQCRGVADVVPSVRFAREHEIRVAIRGGGHNVAGFATCDGGIVIDLSQMKGIRVDPEMRTVRAQAGATWGELDRETQVFGLAAPGGIVSTTGIAGLTLGGGQGWLRRTYGMTCDSLISADVVTAGGDFLTASREQNADLLWALRGGGGNFGVVTSFEYRLYPVGPVVAFAAPMYAIEKAPEALGRFRGLVPELPETINATATFWAVPSMPGFPENLHGKSVVTVAGMYAGSSDEGMRLLQPLRELGERVLDLSSPMPYRAVQQLFDPFFPTGELLYYWKSLYLDELGDEAIEEITSRFAERPSPLSMTAIWALGGAMSRGSARESAAGKSDCPYLVEILANWSDPSDADANVTWAREFFQAMHRFSSGRPNLNFPGWGEDAEQQVRAAHGPNYDRLREVKRKYDPGNLFRLNQNIAP